MAREQAKNNASMALLFIRLALGIVVFAHGAQKVLGWFGGAGFGKTIEIFTMQLGYPLWIVLLLMFIEFGGSIGLILGLMTRLSALGIAASMIVCAYQSHLQNGFFMNWFGQQAGEGIEYHLLVLGMCFALMAQGGGNMAMDRILPHTRRRDFQKIL
jgi:putative oxidoreductase